MAESFHELLARFEAEGLLRRLRKPVDPRHFAALADDAGGPLLFEDVAGYAMPVVTNLVGNRRCLTKGLGVSDRDVGRYFLEAVSRPIPPVIIENAACQEVIHTGRDVDLSAFPIPIISRGDGGPYICGGVVIVKDPSYGSNAGFYRMMYRTRNETGMGVLTPSDMHVYYQRAVQRGQPLEVAVALGLHITELLAASYQAPKDVDELAVAGGLRGEPLALTPAKTVDLAVPADAEIVIEGYLPPTGWSENEGPFGEFTRCTGGVVQMPVFRVTAVTTRRDPIFYSLHMPDENIWLLAPRVEGTALKVLRDARIDGVAACCPPGGSGTVLYVAIRKSVPGDSRDAIYVLLSSIRLLKYVVVVDEDIDVYNQEQIDWALAFRNQPRSDVIVHSGARAAPLDPSTQSWKAGPGQLVTTSKLGIDATIPDYAPRERFVRLTPAFSAVRLADYL